ncbi:MAG: hypothetical protein MRERV_4c093 [Mycoplasmataceae bacterium RV_VA103A]|nr:MAG: hypothetical protein MRERV_11c049 [Mycoplasmataceae bacterium RV_VA103A]KLL05184.1 MAG: hypothetical protein MRERV_4c093 [Mycoplasmataceae bacterium RV_VA103A]
MREDKKMTEADQEKEFPNSRKFCQENNLTAQWDKRYLLIIVALTCLVLYFYGSQISKDNNYLKLLPTIGGLAYGLNTLIQLVH